MYCTSLFCFWLVVVVVVVVVFFFFFFFFFFLFLSKSFVLIFSGSFRRDQSMLQSFLGAAAVDPI